MAYEVHCAPCGSLFLSFLLLAMPGTDWTGWRGPAANGTTSERGWNPKALREPSARWRTEIGTGHGAVVVKGERLYSMGNFLVSEREGEDVVFCLDTNTGGEIWSHVYPCAEKEDPGPCATPLLADGRLYTLSREGHFFCLDAKTGEELWMHHLVEEELTPRHGYFAPSPVLCGELVVLNFNRHGMAFDGKTGELAWNSEPCDEDFATPVVFDFHGERLLAMQRMNELQAVEPSEGEVIWTLARGSIPDPLFLGEDMIVFDFEGIARYRLAKSGPELVWNNDDCRSDFQSYVAVKDHAYGFGRVEDASLLQCLALETGDLCWRSEVEMGALIAADGKLIVVDKAGELIIAKASPAGLEVLSRTRAIDIAPPDDSSVGYRREHSCWTNPVLSHGNIYVRSTYGELVCFDVK